MCWRWRAPVILALLPRVKVLGWPWHVRAAGMKGGIRSSGLSWGTRVVTAEGMLSIGFGKTLLKHSVIISNHGRQLRMKVQQGIYHLVR